MDEAVARWMPERDFGRVRRQNNKTLPHWRMALRAIQFRRANTRDMDKLKTAIAERNKWRCVKRLSTKACAGTESGADCCPPFEDLVSAARRTRHELPIVPRNVSRTRALHHFARAFIAARGGGNKNAAGWISD